MSLQTALGAAAPDSCPAEGTLLELAQGGVAGAEFDALLAHLDGCAQCREMTAELAREALCDREAAREPLPGDSIDRFLLLDELGRGGMGIVYSAFNPTLDRKVALKLLKPDPLLPAATAAKRLLAEAQAMGRLSHPNVVTVFEAKAHGEQVYLAMELIQGESLRELAARRPGTQALLARFCEAGRGLAAAHERGIVHRDFKPDNALLGDDGRVCVTDFGLALCRVPPGSRASRLAPAGPPGTPGYLAPELWLGGDADARSDQFSFCVSLWEALFGARPFLADKGPELLAQVRRGPVAQGRVPLRQAVSLRVRRALHKGLRFEPGERHASMPALLAELEAELRPGPLSTLARPVFAAVALALVGSGAAGHALWLESRSPAPSAVRLPFATSAPTSARAPIDASFALPQSLCEPAAAGLEKAAGASPPAQPIALASNARPRARRGASAAIPPAPLARMDREEPRDAGSPGVGAGGRGGGAGGSNSSSTLAPDGEPLGARLLR